MLYLKMEKTVLFILMLALICATGAIGLSYAEEFNGTTYNVSLSDMEVARAINNSSIDMVLHEKVNNISLLTLDGKRTELNSSYTFWGGDYTYSINFSRRVVGHLVYKLHHKGQLLLLSIDGDGPVRVILPLGYTTGDRILGIARPTPDNVSIDNNQTVLIWQNPGSLIEVGYYKENAPSSLKRIFVLLVVMAIILLLEYYASIRKLRAISRQAEKELK
jgi:hypothetical protein